MDPKDRLGLEFQRLQYSRCFLCTISCKHFVRTTGLPPCPKRPPHTTGGEQAKDRPREAPLQSSHGRGTPRKGAEEVPLSRMPDPGIHPPEVAHLWPYAGVLQIPGKGQEPISGKKALQQVACLRYLAQQLTGTERFDPLLTLLDEEAPEQYTWELPRHLTEEMRALISAVRWENPRTLRIRPSNMPAVLLHWRALG